MVSHCTAKKLWTHKATLKLWYENTAPLYEWGTFSVSPTAPGKRKTGTHGKAGGLGNSLRPVLMVGDKGPGYLHFINVSMYIL